MCLEHSLLCFLKSMAGLASLFGAAHWVHIVTPRKPIIENQAAIGPLGMHLQHPCVNHPLPHRPIDFFPLLWHPTLRIPTNARNQTCTSVWIWDGIDCVPTIAQLSNFW
ncbi:hypothetical protein FRC08_011038 [Ceratobasidium sp. 394]|nr:hypothetical protein FRC08_011038 [Ceratobasidium sp. 394]